jgi:Flp pilus assembly protein CpaB
MKTKTMILMVVAVVCGLGASYMTSRLLAERDDHPAEAPPPEKVKVLVAVKNLQMHTALGKDPEKFKNFFKEKEYSKDDAPKDALTMADLDKLKGKFLKRPLRGGDHITADDITDSTSGFKNLPNGMRAVGIRVNPEDIAGGFASLPGSRVDIIWVARSGDDMISLILLEDVAVLAADTNKDVNESGGAMPASVVTVAVDQKDIETITVAKQSGSLQLVVRNIDDKLPSGGGVTKASDILKLKLKKGDKEPPPQIASNNDPPEAPKDPPKTAEIPPKVDPTPKVQLTKKTAFRRNGNEVTLHHFWVDEHNNIVENPQQYFEQQENDPVPPPPAGDKGKKDTKKTGPDV